MAVAMSSASRCLSGTAMALVLLALGCGTASHFLTTWLQVGRAQSADDVSASAYVDIGLWKVCVEVSASAAAGSLSEHSCASHGGLDYVKGANIGSLAAGFLAFLFIIGAFNGRACQILGSFFSCAQGLAMVGAIARFVYLVNTQLDQQIDGVSITNILSQNYGLAFYGVCVSAAAGVFASILLAVARCCAGNGEMQNDEINLVHVVKA